jgi:hypothetical protein
MNFSTGRRTVWPVCSERRAASGAEHGYWGKQLNAMAVLNLSAVELGTYKTVRTRFWYWLAGESPWGVVD